MKKTALITGISGQDGVYLAEFLIKKNYKVIGTDRRSARSNDWRLKRLGIQDKVISEEMEIGETFEIDRIFKKYKIFYILYNNQIYERERIKRYVTTHKNGFECNK